MIVGDYISCFLNAHQEYNVLHFFCDENIKKSFEEKYSKHYKVSDKKYDLAVINLDNTKSIIDLLSKNTFENALLIIDEKIDFLKVWEHARQSIKKFYIIYHTF